MTNFVLACAGLILFSGVFYLFPRVRPGASEEDLEQANLEWFRVRNQELAGERGEEALQEDARLRLLEDSQQRTVVHKRSSRPFPVWILLPVVAVFSGSLYYLLGAAPDVVIARQLDTLDENAAPEDMQSLIQSMEERSAQRPDNLHYLGLLGRYYMGSQEYARASQIYAELLETVPDDAQALAFAAQADYLAAGRTLNDNARLRAEQALAADPHQRTALGLLGMASFEQKQYRAAIAYWERLVAMETPGSESARMINDVLGMARQQLAIIEPGASAASPIGDPGSGGLEASGPGVTIQVSVPADADIAPTDTVFVLARSADSDSRMPIAVQRFTGAQLPLTVRLDDSNSMAGQKLSETASVIVAVQVSPDGRPGEGSATWLGEVGPVSPGTESDPIEIELQPRKKP